MIDDFLAMYRGPYLDGMVDIAIGVIILSGYV